MKAAPAVEAISQPSVGAPLPSRASEQRLAASPAAGDSDRIPPAFLTFCDLIALGLALLAAHNAAPAMQHLLLSGGVLSELLPEVLRIPPTPQPELLPELPEIVWLLAVTMPVTLVAMELLGGYSRLVTQNVLRVALVAVSSQLVAVSFGALVVLALKLGSPSRVVIFTYTLFAAVALVTYRGAIWTYQRHRFARGVYAKNVLIVGQARAVEWVVEHFQRNVPETEFRLAGWLRVTPTQIHTPERRRDDTLRHIPIDRLGDVDALGELLVHHPIHEVVAIQSVVDRDWLQPVIESCDYFRIRLRIVPEALLVGKLRDLEMTFHGDPLRLPEVVLAPRNIDAGALFVKRAIDIFVSAAGLVVLAPVFLLVAVGIKLSTPGLPVLYPWRVVGLNGRPFTGYKFTTMVADADDQRQQLLMRNEMQGPVFKVKDDPRITPFGRFLRKYSLNELPQLWSVLKGDMSLVGPRPAFRHELDRYELWHKRKLSVKPGITCLWQVGGRNRISNFDDWVRLDLEYIDRWSLWLDMRILARTAWAVVSGSGS